MTEKEQLELSCLRLENEYMKKNIKKLRNIIELQEKELIDAKKKISYRILQKIRKIKNWRR